MSEARPWLHAAAWMSVAASLLHLACIVGGPAWYRFLGAGEDMARAVERGSWVPAAMTAAIAVILAVWAAYAFGAAGTIRRLPLTRTALVAIAAVLLARAAMVFTPEVWAPEQTYAFRFWSSAIVLLLGLCFAIGTWRAWPSLAPRNRG